VREAPAKLFDDADLEAWSLPPDLKPSEWSDLHRVLPVIGYAGTHWRSDASPALAALMDLIVRDTIREVWIKKCVQAGVSTMVQNIVGWVAHLRPCTMLLMLPDEKVGKRQLDREWLKMFQLCAPLAARRTRRAKDQKSTLVRLDNTFELHLAWSGSPNTSAALPCKLVVLDEVDKFRKFDGKDSSPVDLARKRLTTFLNQGAKLIGLTTPTTSEGYIAVEYEACPIKIQFAVACPHCGTFQVLHQQALRWPKAETGEPPGDHASRVEATKAAWFDCTQCHAAIRSDDKREIVSRGRWQTADESWCIYVDGREEGRQPMGLRLGVKYPAFYQFNIEWWDIAAEAIRAGRQVSALMDVTTQRYAEEFKFQEVAVAANTFARLCRPDPETGFVPFPAHKLQPWVMRLLLTVDTQLRGFWWVLRGWGAGLRSHRVAHGQATSFEQIEDLLYQSRWPFVDGPAGSGKRAALGVHRVGIDSGGGIQGGSASGGGEDRTAISQMVYRWCEKDPVYRYALKGNNKPMDGLLRSRRGLFVPPDQKVQPFERTFYLVDSGAVRDLLSSQIHGTVPLLDKTTGEVIDAPQWALNDQDDFEYNAHMSAVKKTRKQRGQKQIIEWGAEDGARHDYADCEAYQIALAVGWNLCTALPTLEQVMAERRVETPVQAGIRRPDGRKFLSRR